MIESPHEKMRRKKKQGKRDQYWELFGAFVLAESSGYRDTLARAEFFNENQTFLRKAPPSATGENACWVRHARRVLFGRPREMPCTVRGYTRLLATELMHFCAWMQDEGIALLRDDMIPEIISRLRHYIPLRFAELAPDDAIAEQASRMARAAATMGGAAYAEQIGIIKAWRERHPDDVLDLSGLLGHDYLPLCSPEEAKTATTTELFRLALHREGSKYTDFSWLGKDVATELANMPELGCLRYKETINGDIRPPDGNGLDVSFDVSQVVDASGASLLDVNKNHYIEGDNLRALKLLMPTYRGKVKMIYIDPPYNTGHKFVYSDKFNEDTEIFGRFLLGPIPHERRSEKCQG